MSFRKMFALSAIVGMILSFPQWAAADLVVDREDFDATYGYSYGMGWQHAVTPENFNVTSAQIQLRVKVWGWPSADDQIRFLCSDTTSFSYFNADQFLFDLTAATNPSPSNFYTVTATLNPTQLGWLNNDKKINVMLVSQYSGYVYYLDWCDLRATGSISVVLPGDFSSPADCDVDGSDLSDLIADVSLIELATFTGNFGKNTCQ